MKKFLLLSFSLVVACGPRPDVGEAQRIIALCGGGRSVSVSASLAADIDTSLKKTGTISAELEDDLRAAFLNAEGVSSQPQANAFEDYVGCVERLLSNA